MKLGTGRTIARRIRTIPFEDGSGRTLQRFATVHASVFNHFNKERSLSSRQNFKANRTAAPVEWRDLCSA